MRGLSFDKMLMWLSAVLGASSLIGGTGATHNLRIIVLVTRFTIKSQPFSGICEMCHSVLSTHMGMSLLSHPSK